MPKWVLFSALLVMTSCGGFRLFSENTAQVEREIASITMERLILEENQTFGSEIDEKLRSLYNYYAIAQKNLYLFDESIKESSLTELYQGQPYLNLLAVRTQVDEIEKELYETYSDLEIKNSKSDIQKGIILKERVSSFAGRSPLSAFAMANLAENLKLEITFPEKGLTQKMIDDEYKKLEEVKDFRIYEKNIEHLSHLMETDIKSSAKKFKPSEGRSGNITGEEFPTKVWALTFNNGPHQERTAQVLKELQDRKLKATFFQLTGKAQTYPSQSKLLRDAGMEIGSHSFSHQELTKVGHMTLEKEITDSTRELEAQLGIDVKFFRLPYGSGVETPAIRQMIVKNNLIHAFWNIDSLDWPPQSPDRIVSRTKRLMEKSGRDSGIILFHEVYKRSVLASSEIMDHLMTDARRTCTLGTIVRDMNEGQNTVCSQKSF